MAELNQFMRLALQEAERAKEQGDVPIGAVMVHNGLVIAAAGNRVVQDCDPTAHAELIVLREAARYLQTSKLDTCELYTTLEPCTMCAQAIAHARIRRLYYAAYDPKGGGVDHGACVFNLSTCHHQPEVISGMGEKQAQEILRSFFEDLRHKKF